MKKSLPTSYTAGLRPRSPGEDSRVTSSHFFSFFSSFHMFDHLDQLDCKVCSRGKKRKQFAPRRASGRLVGRTAGASDGRSVGRTELRTDGATDGRAEMSRLFTLYLYRYMKQEPLLLLLLLRIYSGACRGLYSVHPILSIGARGEGTGGPGLGACIGARQFSARL